MASHGFGDMTHGALDVAGSQQAKRPSLVLFVQLVESPAEFGYQADLDEFVGRGAFVFYVLSEGLDGSFGRADRSARARNQA